MNTPLDSRIYNFISMQDLQTNITGMFDNL